ncbi:DUF2339 domain-containing protein [Photobacterium aphoticum]|nr:DUF2339 domain-containing protein [Photobacterium aphoticum]
MPQGWLTVLTQRWLAHVKQHWLVWLGGLAMVVGAGYLMQVVGSKFTIPAALRMLLAAGLSLLLMGAGEWLHRKIVTLKTAYLHKKSDAYIPATLYAAGMSGLYGTFIFAAVKHQLIAPSVALIAMASLALGGLWFSLRLGPLMAVLGIIGGYSAPLWIGGSEPNLFLLTTYVCVITLASLALIQKSPIRWLISGVILGHSLWLSLIAVTISPEQRFTWFVTFIPISTYLMVFVPRMGWALHFRIMHRARWPFFHPAFSALLLMMITYLTVCFAEPLTTQSLLLFVLPFALLILPAWRYGRAPRIYVSTILVAMLCIEFLTRHLAQAEGINTVWVLLISAALIVLVICRVIGQYYQGDHARSQQWITIFAGPVMLIGSLIWIDQAHPDHRLIWTVFTMVCAIGLAYFALYQRRITTRLSASLHGVLLTVSAIYLTGSAFTFALALQVLLIACQQYKSWFTPHAVTIKVLMSLLILRITLVPFIPGLQTAFTPEWTWMVLSVLPTLAVLLVTRYVLLKHNATLRAWFDAATLHVSVILLFAQTNYLVLGSYNFLLDGDFYSVALFAGQTLALGAVYHYKSRHSTQLHRLYQGYALALFSLAGLLALSLNTAYQPLLHEDISGADWPLFNGLTLGWALPALLAIGCAQYRWYPTPLRASWLYTAGSVQLALWALYSIRQFWQTDTLRLSAATSMAELFTYSVALIIAGALFTYWGVQRQHPRIQQVGLITIGIAAFKVFLWDAAALEGLWRAMSFLGLGASLIALGWLFQHLQRSPTDVEHAPPTASKSS